MRLRSVLHSSKAAQAAATLLACLAASCLLTWPLARDAGTHYPSAPDMPDVNVALWLPAHLISAMQNGHSLWFAPDLLWPDGQNVALLIWNLGIPLFQVPFYLLYEPLQAYNLSLVCIGAFNGLGGFLLGRRIGGVAAGCAGAALAMTNPYVWHELLQGPADPGLLLFVLLTASGLLALHREPTTREAVITGVFWGIAGLCYWFYGYFSLLLVLVLSAIALARRQWPLLRSLVVASVVSALVAGPFAAFLLWQALSDGSIYLRSTDTSLLNMLHAQTRGASLGLSTLVWPLSMPAYLRDLLPLTALAVLVAGLVGGVRRRAGFFAPLGLIAVVLAMGRQLQWTPNELVSIGESALTLPFAWMQAALPGFERMWWPYRFLSLFAVGAAGCAAALVAAVPPRIRWVVAALVVGGASAELRWSQVATAGRLYWDAPERMERYPLFDQLASSPGQHPILSLPFRGFTANRVLWQPYHQQPISLGLGDQEDFMISPEALARTAADPTLRYLKSVGRLHPNQGMEPPPGPIKPALKTLGFHYAVLWADQERQVKQYTQLLGEPDHRESTFVAWKLQ
ncbi:MAG TPA: hypothetical protein DFR83_00945 [Deltaproteobacteria bacterium]|nr:hypothetical protein [Deltaproteobacteria bacterium]